MLKKDLPGFVYSLLVVFILIIIYALLFTYTFPDGINLAFVEWAWKALLVLIPILIWAYITTKIISNKRIVFFKKSFENVVVHDFAFAIIPVIPVLQYIIANRDWLTISNSLLLVLIFFVISILFCVIIPALLSVFAYKYLLIAASTSFLFTIINMASLSASYGWHGQGVLYIQIMVFFALFLFLVILRFLPSKLVSIVIAAMLIANTITVYLSADNVQAYNVALDDLNVMEEIRSRDIKKNNDVLLLVYEAYANYETILHYGYDNHEQLEFLKDHGFYIYHGVYSLGTPTTASMSGVFNLDSSSVSSSYRQYSAGGGAVQTLFRETGYESHTIWQSDYIFRELTYDQIVCDNPFPPVRRGSGFDSEVRLMVDTIMTGEFSDEISLSGVGYEAFLDRKKEVLTTETSPIIVYAHSTLPGHGPSGQGVEPEKSLEYMEWYTMDQLPRANEEMREDVRTVLENRPDSIVIIAGDHGPFLTKDGYGLNRRGNFTPDDVDRYDIQDRFGAFLAIRWPEPDYANKHDIELLQDIFPAVFAYLYNDDALFESLRMERRIITSHRTLGVTAEDGIIIGGKDDGEKLFLYDGN